MIVPFDVLEPTATEAPVVVEIPHAGVYLDPETLAFTVAPARCIARDADLYVDRLFADAPALGATAIVARTSRYVVDLNRAENDLDVDAAEGGTLRNAPRGVIWRLSTDGAPITARRLPAAEVERRLRAVYRPYHVALRDLLEKKRDRFGFAILLCAHSMPDPFPSGRGARWPLLGATQQKPTADVVPGTRGRSTAAGGLIDLVDQLARDAGFTVKHDDPYRGGFTTAHYGRPAYGVHAIQIELARRLYMDAETLRIDTARAESVRCFARTLVTRLGAWSEGRDARSLAPVASGAWSSGPQSGSEAPVSPGV